ncbi:putative disease resistance protein RGA4 [Dichanthelium oligosanthes]|uniref:Putative disease resistance protein RGA4 n=1 Tax=Dichanthelium oligosanthes TaxID=888268 RepID=A0A1E5V728_9POAL|nr:putative disease resistance protein RGA4 [Dichanthelium oligosanthes]
MEPEDVTFQVLKDVTNGFSEERKLGEGAYGVVYRGVTKNGEDVAVKKLRDVNPDHDDKQFQNEFYNLMKLKHNNIVQILGYCYETEQIQIEHNGRIVLAEKTYRALCFEYLHNGSLQKHLSNEHCGLDWHTRYKIIKGICDGLKYIHEELENPLYHLDLKPDNILLDEDMMPKIADFGLSRIFGKELTRTSQSPLGTCGYQPPEYIERGEISKKFDIFSLGVVMIRIVSGPEGFSKCQNMPYDEFIDLFDSSSISQVRKNWRNMLQATWSGSLLEAYCHQVERCTQIALKCVEKDSQKRHDIVMIIDMLNEIETDILKLPQKGCRSAVPSTTMHDMMTKTRKQQQNITEQYQHFNFMTTSSRCHDQEFVDIRKKKSLDAGEEQIVGRTEEKMKIMDSLLGMKEKIIILPIYGIGGIGKTTFAKLIYEDKKFKHYSRVWVYVSPRFDLNKIGNSIISQLSRKDRETNENREMDNILMKILSDKEILIVLDDLWEDNPFLMKDLKSMLNLGVNNNTIVLVTTRSEHIAKKICVTVKPYKIQPLTNDMCWDIIKQRSYFEAREDKEQLIGIGREIALKCGGVALAAQSLGYMLQFMKSDEWEKVKENDIWNEYISEDGSSPNHVLASLKLSCSSMDPCLRSCFAYCSVFPKGHKIVKDDLIHQWISLGFIKPTKILSPMQLCEKYIVQLLGLSFLQHSVLPTAPLELMPKDLHYSKVSVFTMHDLVHDMARLDMANEILDGSKQGITGESSGQYALLTDCSKPLKSSTCYPDKIRVLRFLDCGQIKLHGNAFSSAKSLRVLDLSECRIYKLPACIGELVKLRYLNAPKIQCQTIPYSITKLSKLIYLNLSGSRMLELPDSIGDLRGLMHLDISNCEFIHNLPKSFMNLKRLVYLDLSNSYQLRGVSKVLGGLTNIQYLNLSMKIGYVFGQFLEGLPEVIGNLVGLQYLGLSHTIRYIFRNPGSDELFSFIDRICTLPYLQHLDLSNNHSIISVPESIGNLRNLHTLDLSCCTHLVRLPECLVRLDSVKIVNVTNCCKLEKSALSRSKIFDLLPHFVVQADDGASNSNIGLLRYANPSELHITCLDNVKSAEEVQSIKLIEKQGINDLKLQWTRDTGRSVEDVEVLASLVPPSTLRAFNMTGYNSVSFPAWLMNITLYLQELSKIELWDICKCNSLPPLGQLQNLRELVIGEMDSITTIEENFCGGARAFPQLKRFRLCHMENLEAWKTMYSYGKDVVKEFMFPNLKELLICDCPKLRIEPSLPRAKNWEIENSNNVLSLWVETCATSSAAPMDVYVTVRSDRAPLDQWKLFHHLSSLSTIHISCCTDDLTCSSNMLSQFLFNIKSRWCTNPNDLHLIKPMKRHVINDLKLQWTRDAGGSVEDVEVLGKLVPPSSLREFNMTGYSSVSFPAWVMDITLHLPGLSKIELWDIRKCNSLPPLGQLTNLRELVIGVMDSITTIDEDFCGGDRAFPELRKFCLCHMENLELWKTMYSYDKGGVKKFMFPNLVELLIRDCPDLRLKPWPPRAKRWEIESSDKVLSSWGEGEATRASFSVSPTNVIVTVKFSKVPSDQWRLLNHLPAITELRIIGCTDLTCSSLEIIGDISCIKSLWLEDNTQPELPKWLGGLMSVRKMDITGWKELCDLQGSMRHLTSLQELSLIDCPRITVLPEWLGELTALKKLQFRYCKGIKSLPQSIQKLTKLKGLTIYHCPELAEWCKLEKNEKMLAHIKVKVYALTCYLLYSS